MYLAHYNLKEKPFKISTDPKFIWLGENHKETLAILEYGVLDNKGFLLITGDVGTGKTTLINTLLKRLDKDVIVANITNPILERLDFLNFIANEFNLGHKFRTKGDFLIHFSRFLNNCHANNKKVILIIDEAHRLDQELLEQIRLLSNIERQDTKLINIFFIGQDEFIDIISDVKNRALKQRITINYHLDPLKASETAEYILHRLKVAGHEGNIFTATAMDEIFFFSKGYPRLINIICDHALLTGYAKDKKTITAEIIKECGNELLLPNERIDESDKNPGTPVAIPPMVGEESLSTFSKKIFGFTVLSMVLILMLILFYSPGKFGEQIRNIKKYFRNTPNVQTELTSTDMPQTGNPDRTTYPVVTDLSSNTHDGSIQEKKEVVRPPETDNIQNPISAEVADLKNRPDNRHKRMKVPKIPPIPDKKYTINFGYDSNDLSDKDFETLEQINELLALHPEARIIIKGYTDSRGNYWYNKKLSKFRANLVKSFFVGQGVNPSRIKTFGMGPEEPRELNSTIEGRSLNRRVEIQIKKP